MTKDNYRNFTAMPRNAVALMTTSETDKTSAMLRDSMQFFIRRDEKNKNSGFFTPVQQSDWFWPICGLSHGGKIFIFAIEAYANGTGPFGFAFRGTAVITVDNPSVNPLDWTYTYKLIPGTNNDVNFATALLVENDYAYIFGTNLVGTVLSRIKLEDLSSGNLQKLEKWAGTSSPAWTLDPSQPLVPLFEKIPETTVQYFPYVSKYFVLQIPFFGDKILISWADKVEGPWSSWEVIYEIPFPWNDSSHGIFCYAPKSHPEMAKAANEIIFTYANNDVDLFDLVKRIDIYVPQFVRVQVNLQ